MADIQLRFFHDMLVLSGPVEQELRRLGAGDDADWPMMLLLEPEAFESPYKLESLAGAQCLVTPTEEITPARLAHRRMSQNAEAIAKSALEIVCALRPQHVLAQIGPCGLPLDGSSRQSLNENADQYKRAALVFEQAELDAPSLGFDGFFLNRFVKPLDLECALIGMAKVSSRPVFASVDADKMDERSFKEAVRIMAEYGAQVVGMETARPPEAACKLAEAARDVACLPMLVQLNVGLRDPEQEMPTPENPYFEADTMVDAADMLRASGVQFLRATGDATPAYTGALVAATESLDVEGAPKAFSAEEGERDLEADIESLRAKVSAAIKGIQP